MSELVKISVDFNNSDTEGFFYSLVDHADGEVTEGQTVLLWDADGNKAEAEILRIENNLIYSRVDWNTWGNRHEQAT